MKEEEIVQRTLRLRDKTRLQLLVVRREVARLDGVIRDVDELMTDDAELEALAADVRAESVEHRAHYLRVIKGEEAMLARVEDFLRGIPQGN